MFKTHRGLILKDGEAFDPAEHYLYTKMVEMDLSLPWFHVLITTVTEGEEYRLQVMPGDIEMLENLLELTKGQDVSLDVSAVLPPHITGRDGWSMERLASLHEVRTSDNKFDWFYTLASGAVFRDGDGETLSLHDAPKRAACLLVSRQLIQNATLSFSCLTECFHAYSSAVRSTP